MLNPPIGSVLPGSQRAICRSLIFENPVVTNRLCSPSQTTLLLLAPLWPGASWTGFCWRTSQTRTVLSRDVVAIIVPGAFQARLCTMSLCLSARGDWPVPMSQILTEQSPEAEARIFSAAGLKRTCPTFLSSRQTSASSRPCKTYNCSSRHTLRARQVCSQATRRELLQH